MARITLQPAFILHTRPFSDAHVLIELLTKIYGRVGLLARNVRNSKSQLRSILTPFQPLLVSWSGKTDLPTLQQAEPSNITYMLNGTALFSGFYLNEVLMRLLPRHDPHETVFLHYEKTLAELSQNNEPEIVLRLFEKMLLAELGYGLQLEYTCDEEPIEPNIIYSYTFGVGLKRTTFTQVNALNEFPGQSLLALIREDLSTPETRRDAKRLLRLALTQLLGSKPLRSRELFFKDMKVRQLWH